MIVVEIVIAGVVDAVATVPAKPLPEVTETEVTEPELVPTATPLTKRPVALIVPAPCTPPVGAPTSVPVVGLNVRLPVGLSDVRSVFAPEAAAPMLERVHVTLADPSKVLAVAPMVKVRAVVNVAALPVVFWLSVGNVQFVNVPVDGVPSAPPLTTKAPAVPTATPSAVATLVPKPLTPVEIGRPVALVSVPEEGVPSAPPLTTKAPAVPVLTPSAVTTPVPVVTVAGATPAPPPTTIAFAARAADVAHADALEK